MHYHRGCSVSLPCSEWERVGPLRWDHQNSDEFEATFQAHWGDSHWGDESDLKFARVLATRWAGFDRASREAVGRAGSDSASTGGGRWNCQKNRADSLTSTYRQIFELLRLSFKSHFFVPRHP